MNPLPFFSIVVPAYNESAYIEETLERLLALDYPRESFEIIVVENGSTDDTLERARAFEDRGVKVLVSPETGVSRARNIGAREARTDGDWVFFLDADTHLEPPFLKALAAYLCKNARPYAVGTAQLLPWPPTVLMNSIYGCTNLSFMLTRAAYGGALLIRRPLLATVSFDEMLVASEDTDFAMRGKREGAYFFFRSSYARTSTRRFSKGGYLMIPSYVGMWLFGILASTHANAFVSIQRRFKYKAIR